jgi:hypothetical protein
MPFTATSIVEVRADGNDANGGAYDPSIAGGTDYTHPVPQAFPYADLVLGTGGLTVSSVSRPFVAADAGNFLNITAGAGFTIGRWRINSVAAGVATLQSSAGTAGSTGGVGRLGGALASMAGLASALAGSAAGATCWIRGASGELAINALVTLPAVGSATAPTKVCGYGSVRDDGVKPTIRIGSAVSIAASKGALLVLDNYVLSNLTLRSHNDLYTAAYSCIELRGANVYCDRLDVTGGSFVYCAGPCRLLGCQIRDCDVFADIYFGTSAGRTVECHDIAIYGGRFVGNVGSISVIDCRTSISPTRAVCGISQANVNVGICRIARTTLSGGSQGIASTQPGTIVERCVVVGVTGTGISLVAGCIAVDNALWGNTTKYSASTPVLRDINLTAQPLTNANAGDLRPNNVAGGGAVLREFALPTMINPYGANIGASGRIGGVTVPITSADVTSIAAAILVTPANKLATDTQGAVRLPSTPPPGYGPAVYGAADVEWEFQPIGPAIIPSTSVEYVKCAVEARRSGRVLDPTAYTLEFAFVESIADLPSATYYPAEWDEDGVARLLIGPGTDIELSAGLYLWYVRVASAPETTVRRLPLQLRIEG